MGKLRVTIRMYRTHDLDLITFVETHKLNFQKAMYCALTSFTKDELFLIEIPPKREDGKQLDLKRVYTTTLVLDSDKDKDSVELLNKINKGKRNNFLKNLLRLYLCNPMSENFLVDESDDAYFYQKFSIFRKGKRIANLNEGKKRNLIPQEKERIIKKEKTKEITEVKDEQGENESIQKESIQNETIKEEETSNEGENITDLFSAILG